MKPLTAQDPETKSPDLTAENIEQLKALFPEAVIEGKIDFEVLKQLLGGTVDEREEKYGLNWNGKRRARQIALTPSTGTLRPCPEDSVDWDTTQNLMIEGDNLEVLKLLQKSYAGKVKLIYTARLRLSLETAWLAASYRHSLSGICQGGHERGQICQSAQTTTVGNRRESRDEGGKTSDLQNSFFVKELKVAGD